MFGTIHEHADIKDIKRSLVKIIYN